MLSYPGKGSCGASSSETVFQLHLLCPKLSQILSTVVSCPEFLTIISKKYPLTPHHITWYFKSHGSSILCAFIFLQSHSLIFLLELKDRTWHCFDNEFYAKFPMRFIPLKVGRLPWPAGSLIYYQSCCIPEHFWSCFAFIKAPIRVEIHPHKGE